jgi:hypothetical protein
LKLQYDEPLSRSAYNSNLRRYTKELEGGAKALHGDINQAQREAGAYTRPLLSSTQAVLVSAPFCVQFAKSYDPSIY